MKIKPRTRLSQDLKQALTANVVADKTQELGEVVTSKMRELLIHFMEYLPCAYEGIDRVANKERMFPQVVALNLELADQSVLLRFPDPVVVPFCIWESGGTVDLKHPDFADFDVELFNDFVDARRALNAQASIIKNRLFKLLNGYKNLSLLLRDHPYLYPMLPDDVKQPDEQKVASLDELLGDL